MYTTCMGSYINREELEEFTSNMKRDTLIMVFKIYFIVIVSGAIFYKYIL